MIVLRSTVKILQHCQRAVGYRQNFNLMKSCLGEDGMMIKRGVACFSEGTGKGNNNQGKQTKEEVKDQKKNQSSQSPLEGEQNNDSSHRLWPMLIAAGLTGMLTYKFMFDASPPLQPNTPIQAEAQAQPKMKLGGDWSLTDTEGKPFTSKDLQGKYYLIYFGFTKCPDICPTTLHYLANVYKKFQYIPTGNTVPLKMIFISVDPQRDSPAAIKEYLRMFNSQIIGLSAYGKDQANLKECMKKYKIYANRIALQNGNYNVDHTTMVYLMDPHSQYLDHINPSLSEKHCAAQLFAKIQQYEKVHPRQQTKK